MPTVAELTSARELRDSGWSAVKRLWKSGDNGGEREFLARTGHSDLAAAYEGTVADADSMADHMRDHARQVEQLAALDAEIEVRRHRLDEADISVASAAEVYLNCVREIDAELKKAADLEHRIATMRADADRFAAEVSELAARLTPEHTGLEPEAAIGHLHRSLTEAHQNLKLLEQKRSQQSEIEVKLEAVKQSAARCAAELDGLCREASAADAGAAHQAWAVSSGRRELEKRVAEYDERLRLVSAGKTMDEFLDEAAAVDADSITGSLDEIHNAIASRRQERARLANQRDELNVAGGAMRGGDQAASAAQHISGLVGRLTDAVEEYVRWHTATFVIRKAIERYRERNQGPVLERASRLFADLTRASFTSLRVESDEGSAILVGVRPNGEIVPLPGMSDGTLDQLYLSGAAHRQPRTLFCSARIGAVHCR